MLEALVIYFKEIKRFLKIFIFLWRKNIFQKVKVEISKNSGIPSTISEFGLLSKYRVSKRGGHVRSFSENLSRANRSMVMKIVKTIQENNFQDHKPILHGACTNYLDILVLAPFDDPWRSELLSKYRVQPPKSGKFERKRLVLVVTFLILRVRSSYFVYYRL